MGDLHNPLHLTGKPMGGNRDFAYFKGTKFNMHGLWDYGFLEEKVRKDFGSNVDLFSQYLLKKSSIFMTSPGSCALNDHKEQNVFGTSFCPISWASEISQLNCKVVWRNYTSNMKVTENYFITSIQVIESSVITAGLRLAESLNNLFT
jgi:hypothetical protein